MSDAMFTQLSISVQGTKGSGKTEFTEQVLAVATMILGGEVVSKKDKPGGVYLTISLPMGALKPGNLKIIGRDILPDELVIEGGKAKLPAADAVGPRDLFPLDPAGRAEVFVLLEARDRLAKILATDDPVGKQLVQVPEFMPRATVNKLVLECAAAEAVDLDAKLAALGFRYAPAAP